jgi:high affinity Mn2+ porin
MSKMLKMKWHLVPADQAMRSGKARMLVMKWTVEARDSAATSSQEAGNSGAGTQPRCNAASMMQDADIDRLRGAIQRRGIGRRRGASARRAVATMVGAIGAIAAACSAEAQTNDVGASAEIVPAVSLLAKAAPTPSAAKPGPEELPEGEDWSLHFQATSVYQGYPGFNSPFEGPQSLSGNTQFRETLSATGFLGRRLPWSGGEFYFNPEINQGFGLQHTLGLAGFPNGEAQKAAALAPVFDPARLFIRQVFGLGGEQETLEPRPNQLGKTVDIARITVTFGKLAITDIFDNNAYSHDPRTQFFNWALMDGGAYDYAADQKGYSEGGVIELNQKSWALRSGYFLVPNVSNVSDFDKRIFRTGGYNTELETRYDVLSQPGKFRILGFANNAVAGSYAKTLENPAFGTDIAQTRRIRTKYGFVLNLEQALNDDLGVFSRYSWNDGREEIVSFTDIDRSFSAGMSLKGTSWGRRDDVVGIAGVVNMLTNVHRDFLAAGGLGIIIGDGRLNYAPESIIEAYYDYRIIEPLSFTVDYQFVDNPAYNQDRGPVNIFAARLHIEF